MLPPRKRAHERNDRGDRAIRPLDEYRGDPCKFDLAAAVARGKPLVIRGLVRDWLIVKLALQSDTVFAQRLAELDNGADVTTLMIAPEAEASSAIRPISPTSTTSISRCRSRWACV